MDPTLLQSIFDIETRFTRRFSVDMPYGSLRVDLPLPSLPIVELSHPSRYFPGMVAADMWIWGAERQDPRLTAKLPPYPAQRRVLSDSLRQSDIRQARVSEKGVVLGVKATDQLVPFSLTYKSAAITALFGDVKTSQSQDGRFQTRAAEMLGGATAATLNQPGVAAALLKVAASPAGLPYQQIRNLIESERGIGLRGSPAMAIKLTLRTRPTV